MNLKLIEFKDKDGNDDVRVYLDEYGKIYQAECWNCTFETYVDCTEYMRKSDYWKEQIYIKSQQPPPEEDPMYSAKKFYGEF